MRDHFSSIGFFLQPRTNPLVLAGEAVRQGTRFPGGVPGITVITHAWEAGAGLGIWAITHEERKDLLTTYPVFRARRIRPFHLTEMVWDGAEGVAHGSLEGVPIAFHVSNYCRDSLWEIPPDAPGSAAVAGLGYGARLLRPGAEPGRAVARGELHPAAPASPSFNQEACDYAFHGRILRAELIRNPVTFVRLWHLAIAGDRPAPWELEVVLPRAWLRRPWFWSRPRPGDCISGLCWLQGSFNPEAASR